MVNRHTIMGIAKFLMFLPDWMYPHIYSDIPSDWYHVSFTRPLGWALCNRQVGRTKSGRPSPVLPEPEGRCKGNTATRGWTMYGLVMFRDLDNTLEILLDSKRGFQYFRIAWGTLKYLEESIQFKELSTWNQSQRSQKHLWIPDKNWKQLLIPQWFIG